MLHQWRTMQMNCDPQGLVRFAPPDANADGSSGHAVPKNLNNTFDGNSATVAGSGGQDSSVGLYAGIVAAVVAVVLGLCAVFVFCWRRSRATLHVVDVSIAKARMGKSGPDIEAPKPPSQPKAPRPPSQPPDVVTLRVAARAPTEEAACNVPEKPQEQEQEQVQQKLNHQARNNNVVTSLPTPARAPCVLRPP